MNEEHVLDALIIAVFFAIPALAVLGVISGATCGLLMIGVFAVGVWQLA